jgi:hypothetical protein
MKLTARQQDKLIEAAQNAITFTVTGSGQFPMDMLRYDCCWPASETESRLVAVVADHGAGTPVDIKLKGLKVPTFARWRSFGWSITQTSFENFPVR